MSELDFPLSELRKLEKGGESCCSCMRLGTSPLRAPMNEIVMCCLLCLTSPETVPVGIGTILVVRLVALLLVFDTHFRSLHRRNRFCIGQYLDLCVSSDIRGAFRSRSSASCQ